MIFSFAPRFGLLGLFVLISACQSFPDGERRLADETARSFQDSLAHSQAALQAPLPATRGAPVEPPVPPPVPVWPAISRTARPWIICRSFRSPIRSRNRIDSAAS